MNQDKSTFISEKDDPFLKRIQRMYTEGVHVEPTPEESAAEWGLTPEEMEKDGITPRPKATEEKI